MRVGNGRGGARVSRSLPLLSVAAALLAATFLAGCAAAAPSSAPEATRSPSATTSPSPSPSPSPEVPPIPQGSAALGAPATVVPPTRLVMSDLSIDMTVEAEGIDADGAMALPEDAATAGWYQFGPGLGNAAGATVIAAHIDSSHDGIGPFSRLKDAAPGSIITVTGEDGAAVDYAVSEVRSVGKIDAPMAEVFDRTGPARLTLVTCGGIFDSSTGHYVDNIILTALPVTAPTAG